MAGAYERLGLSQKECKMGRAAGLNDKDAGPGVRAILAKVKQKLGRVSPGMRVRALDQQFLRASVQLDFYNAAKGKVPRKLKEIAQLKVAMMVGCPF